MDVGRLMAIQVVHAIRNGEKIGNCTCCDAAPWRYLGTGTRIFETVPETVTGRSSLENLGSRSPILAALTPETRASLLESFSATAQRFGYIAQHCMHASQKVISDDKDFRGSSTWWRFSMHAW